jgi:hypothetical protein
MLFAWLYSFLRTHNQYIIVYNSFNEHNVYEDKGRHQVGRLKRERRR